MIKLFDVFMAPEAIGNVGRTLARNDQGLIYIGEGKQVEAFERALQDLLSLPYAPLVTNSCTSALSLALQLIGVGPGDSVLSTPMTCTATNCAIVNRGARIIWADSDPLTGLIDPDDVARKIGRKPKAIMAVDWGGRVCDYTALKQHGIPVIQDAAHSLLAGCGGDYVCWSFGAIKHLTSGDGGALLPPMDQYQRARLLRWYGLDRRSSQDFRCAQSITEAGMKWHMNDIAASIGLANVPHARAIVDAHRANAAYYHDFLRDLEDVILPPRAPTAAWWLYTLLVEDRPDFIAYLAERAIATSPVHARNDTHPAFHFPSGPLPGVDRFASCEVAIPVHWALTSEERQRVAQAVIDWAKQQAA